MWIYGIRPVIEALREPQRVERVLVARGRKLPKELVDAASGAGIRLERVPPGRIERLARGVKHQGIAARISPISYREPKELVARTLEEKGVLVCLYRIYDPRNLGAIARTAEGLGASGLLLAGRGAGITPAAVKASAGALFHIPVARVANPKPLVEAFQREGGEVVAAHTEGEPLGELRLHKPLMVILGSEGEGLPAKLVERCRPVRIPMRGKVASFNVSVAAAIILWEALG